MPPIWSYSFVLLLQLSLLNGGGLFAQSTPSKPAQFTLKGVDIGDVGEAGSTALDDATGEYSVTGSGTDIFGTSDEFHYAHMAWSGDGEIIARVTDVAETNQHAKAGVMFRESLDADSAHAVMEIKASAGAEFQSRQQKGKKTSYNDTKGIKAPHFVRLVRRGNPVFQLLLLGFAQPSIIGEFDLVIDGFPRRHVATVDDRINRLGSLGNVLVGHQRKWSRLPRPMTASALVIDDGRDVFVERD